MITKSKLAELRAQWEIARENESGLTLFSTLHAERMMITIETLLNENEKLRRVIKAREAVMGLEQQCVECKGPTAFPCGSGEILDELNRSIAALEGKE